MGCARGAVRVCGGRGGGAPEKPAASESARNEPESGRGAWLSRPAYAGASQHNGSPPRSQDSPLLCASRGEGVGGEARRALAFVGHLVELLLVALAPVQPCGLRTHT